MWYNESWLYRQKITIDHTKVAEALANYPVYLNLLNLGAVFFAGVKNGGGDIRITTDDGVTEIAREVVTCVVGEANSGEVYFKAPTLSNTVDTVFYIYYGNSGASDYAVTDAYGRNAVWSNGYLAVYHLATDNFTSSTGNYNGTNVNTTNVAGKIGVAKAFSGSGQAIALTNMQLISAITYQAWVTHGTLVNWAKIISKTLTSQVSPYCCFNLCVDNSANKLLRAEVAIGATQYVANSTTVLPTGLSFCVATYDNANVRVWLNAVNERTTPCTGGAYGTTDPVQIGRAYFGGSPTEYWTGNIDEARISNVARSAGWISTDYNNQNSPATFYAIGPAQKWITKTLDYRIRKAIGKTAGLLYAIKKPISILKSLVYAIKTYPGITKGATYLVRKPIDKTTSAEYRIRTVKSITKGADYAVKGWAESTKVLGYSVRKAVEMTKDTQYTVKSAQWLVAGLEYAIKTPQSKEKTAEYRIRTIAGIEAGLSYEILTKTEILKGVDYAIRTAPAIELPTAYKVKYQVALTLNSEYAVTTPAGITKDADYFIRIARPIEKECQYCVKAPAGKTIGLNYEVVAAGAVAKVLQYAIKSPVGKILSENYAIRIKHGIMTGLQYAITAGFALSKGLIYRVKFSRDKTAGLKYAVKKEIGITSGLDYKIRKKRAITKPLAYRIIRHRAKTKNIKYTIRSKKSITKGLEYFIGQELGITKALLYKVKAKHEITKGLKYTIPSIAGITRGCEYRIRIAHQITKPLTYITTAHLSIMLPLKYTVKAEAPGITKGLEYVLEFNPYEPGDDPYEKACGPDSIYESISAYSPFRKK